MILLLMMMHIRVLKLKDAVKRLFNFLLLKIGLYTFFLEFEFLI